MVKKVNVLICFALSMVLLFSPVVVSASSIDDYISFTNSLALEEPAKDMNITTTSATFTYGYTNDMSSWGSVNITYGALVNIFNRPIAQYGHPGSFAQFALENKNGVLFNQSGIITLRMVARCDSLTLRVYRTNGNVDETVYDADNFNNYQVDLKVENYDCDVFKINVSLSDAPTIHDDDYLSTSLQYGYKFEDKALIDVISDFFSNYFSNFSLKLKNVFSDFFNDIPNTSEFADANNQLDDVQFDLLESVGSVKDISFDVDIMDDASLIAAFGFIAPILSGLFANIKFSVIFNVTCTLFIAVVALGFARHWKGR